MSVQPTPGPWEWWTSCSWKRLTSKDSKGAWMKQGNVLCPTVASDGHPDLVVSEADMALIAAAPDLLEALKAAKEVVDVAEGMTACRSDDDFIWSAQKLINAALAKATSPSTPDMEEVSHG